MRKRYLLGILILLLIILAITVAWADKAAAPDSTYKTTTNSGSAPNQTSGSQGFNKQAYSTSDPASIWVVVNKRHPLSPKTYAPSDLAPVGNGQYMRAEAAQALAKMIAGAKAAGFALIPESGYRSYTTQVAVYNSEVSVYGQAYADTESARPGYSEHQTGWAIDLGSDGCNIQDCFGNTPGGKWAIANAYKYGFLLRYPADKVDITGYRNEAWHFRYVGTLLSNEMHQEHIQTLEEFFGISGGTSYE